MPLVTFQWVSFIRVEMLNRYHDTSRFIEVDGIPVTNSDQNRSIQITAGFHDIKVYFSWGLGSQRGLASAMVEYSKNRGNISKTLRLNARSGELYLVMADPGVRWQSTEHRQLVVCGLLGGEWWEFWNLFERSRPLSAAVIIERPAYLNKIIKSLHIFLNSIAKSIIISAW